MGTAALTFAALVLIGGIALWWRHRRRTQALPLTAHTVLCPVHEEPAHVSVRTDRAAQSCRQYLAVAGCSLLDETAGAHAERITHLPDADFPLVTLRVQSGDAYPDPVAGVSCRQDCVFVLNETAVFNARPPVECTSGVSDAVELERQTSGDPKMTRILSYFGA